MRRYPFLVTATAVAVLSGCSPSTEEPAADTSPPRSSATEPAPQPRDAPVRDGAIKVSPDGVTTAVDVPSMAEESQYGQACLAAKRWFDAQRGSLEAYLKSVQAAGAVGPESFNVPWADLTSAQQAGVIMAAEAAAQGQCG